MGMFRKFYDMMQQQGLRFKIDSDLVMTVYTADHKVGVIYIMNNEFVPYSIEDMEVYRLMQVYEPEYRTKYEMLKERYQQESNILSAIIASEEFKELKYNIKYPVISKEFIEGNEND